MSTQHTPGPWTVQIPIPESVEFHRYVKAGDDHIAYCCDLEDASDEARANAHLIASAPDLLEALQSLLASVTEETAPDGYVILRAPARSDFNRAKEAITKATGEKA